MILHRNNKLFVRSFLQVWLKQSIQRAVSSRSGFARCPGRVQSDRAADQRGAEKDAPRQRKVAVLWLRLLLLHLRMFSMACDMFK